MGMQRFERERRILKGLPGQVHAGEKVGIPSVCSANRWVLDAVLSFPVARDSLLFLVEATASQIHPGGYAGMSPAAFVKTVEDIGGDGDGAAETASYLIGGDHIGPYPWRRAPAGSAIARSVDLVTACVAAGMVKLHLDASTPCAGDPVGGDGLLPMKTAAERTARLAAAAEAAWKRYPDGIRPLYVIGTDVPTPGGAGGAAERTVTPRAALDAAIALTRRAFDAAGVADAWDRVVAVVVQPGVGFSNLSVTDYRPELASDLVKGLDAYPNLVFEAHSTDYQTVESLRRMVGDRFAILKVGPELTYGFREAVFALALVERELLRGRKSAAPSRLMAVLDRAMVADPEPWRAYYRCEREAEPMLRRYALTDRCRYYWNRTPVAAAFQRLLENLHANPIPMTLVSQYFPDVVADVRSGAAAGDPKALIRARIQKVWRRFLEACRPRPLPD